LLTLSHILSTGTFVRTIRSIGSRESSRSLLNTGRAAHTQTPA